MYLYAVAIYYYFYDTVRLHDVNMMSYQIRKYECIAFDFFTCGDLIDVRSKFVKQSILLMFRIIQRNRFVEFSMDLTFK